MINLINKKDKCFQYTVTVALNYEEIIKDLKRITKVISCLNKYNWEGIDFPAESQDWKKVQKNNVTIAPNVLYAKKEKIHPPYVSKHNSNSEKHVSLLMILNREKQWLYLAVKNYQHY